MATNTLPKTGYKSVGVKKQDLKNNPAPAGMQNVLQKDGTYKAFQTPTGTNPAPQTPAPAPQPTFEGGVKYKATGTKGVYTTPSGEYVDAGGNPVAAPTPYQPTAKDLANSDFVNTMDTANEFGIPTEGIPTSLDEWAKMQMESQRKQEEALKKQQGMQEGLDTAATSRTRNQGEMAIEGTNAALAQGREGVMGSSAPIVANEFSQRTKQVIEEANTRLQMANDARTQALADLKTAQQDQNWALAEQIKSRIAGAESQIRQEEVALMDAENQASKTALDWTKYGTDAAAQQAETARQNLTTFSTLVETGAELTPQGLKSLSTQLGLDFETAFDFYEGAKAIREEKGLSNEDKQVRIDQLKQDLQDQQAGLNIAEVKKLSIIEDMYKSGASQEEISRAKDAFGLTDDQDPIYQLELEIKRADAKIKTAEANGQLISPLDQLDYASKVAELMEKTGGTGSYKPTNSKYGVTATANGIVVDVATGSRPGRGQCGEFVNDVLGIGVGDKLSDKTKFIDKSIIVPSAGMAFVSPKGYDLGGGVNSGHIGIVESVNPDGTFNTVEANENGDEKITRRQNVPVTEVVGFIRPPKAEFIGNVGAGTYSETQKRVLDSLAGVEAKDIDTTTLKVLEEAGLTSTDLLSYETESRALPPAKQEEIQNVLDGISKLKEMDKGAAVGASLQKVLPWVNSEDGFIAGTDAANFKAQFDKFRDNLVLPSLDKLKGAMSDKDIQFLRNAATALNLDMSEAQFMEELNNLESKYKEVLGRTPSAAEIDFDEVSNYIQQYGSEEAETANKYGLTY